MSRSFTVALNLLAQLMVKHTSADTIDKLADSLSLDPERVEKGERLLELLEQGATEEELLAVVGK